MKSVVNAVQFLRDDHKRIHGLFQQLGAIPGRAPEMRDGVIRELLMELEIHTQLEEQFFYPKLREKLDPLGDADVQNAILDHENVLRLISEIRASSFESDAFAGFVRELQEAVSLHVTDEEAKLFPLAERVIEDGFGVEELERRRAELLGSPEYRDARPESVQNPNGGEQSRRGAA